MTLLPTHSHTARPVSDEQVEALHDKIISIDTHNDFSLGYCFPKAGYSAYKGQVSFEYMRQGRLDAAIFAAYLEQGPCDEAGHLAARERADSLLRGLHRFAAEHPDECELAYTADDVERIKRSGKKAMMLSIENGYCLGTDLSLLQHYYDMGVRMLTLTHNGANEIADTATDQGARGGLTPFGREVIAEMNRLGIVIDLSHASRLATLQAAEASEVPVVASHSGCYGVRAHRRNLTDKEIRAIAERGGVIHVALVRSFLTTLPKGEEGVEHIVEHVDYLVRLVGAEHVGFGSDFDGGGGLRGCRNMSQMKHITRALMERGYTDEQIAAMWGGNTLRVLRAAEAYARRAK